MAISSTRKKKKKAKRLKKEALDPEIVESSPFSKEDVDDSINLDDNLVPEDSKFLTLADPVTRYMAELRKYSLLSKEQEYDLAVRYYETGDPSAAEKLVTSNLRFVVKVAAEYARFGGKLIDLIQEGNVGLMHAVKEFNPYKGVRLITYAVWWIRGYIQEYLMRQYSMVRIGTTANQRKLFYQLQKQKEELERMGREQGLAQLSGRLGISEDEIQTMQQRLSGRDLSLDQPVSDNGSTSLMDLQSSGEEPSIDDQLEHMEQIQLLTDNIDRIRPELNDREVFLLENRLLADDPLTLQEIGEKYGITREAVRQMETRLLAKIRQTMLTT